MFRYLKPPKVYPYASQWVVKADYEHEGVTYKHKAFGIKGDGLAELLGIPSTEERERKAIELATRKWMASTPASESPAPVIPEPIARGERARKEPERLDNEQEPIKRRKGQEPTGQRHEAKQHKGKGHCAQNMLRIAGGCAAGAWQKLGFYFLKAVVITSVLGEYKYNSERTCSVLNPLVSYQDLPMLIIQAGLLMHTWRWALCTPTWHRRSHERQQQKPV